MVDPDILYAKSDVIQRCLARIRSVTRFEPESLTNLDVQDIFVLNLQRAAQAAIDLASHVASSEGLGLPRDLKESFELISKAGVIPEHLSEKLKKMVGFRNIAVHDYQNLNPAVLKAILSENLKDLEEFYAAILKHYHLVH